MRERGIVGITGEVKPVVIATEPFKVRVTKRDVKNADKRSPMTCAIAQGASHLPSVLSAKIGKRIALIEFKDHWVKYQLKPTDTQRVVAFDHSGYFEPGTYELDVPESKPSPKKDNRPKRSHGKAGKHVTRAKPMRHALRASLPLPGDK